MRTLTPMLRSFGHQTSICVVIGMILITSPAAAETVTHNEDFTSLQFADVGLTTADWDTTAGELRLHPQGLVTIGSLSVTGEAYAAAWKDNHVLLAAGSGNALLIVDAGDPAAPQLVKTHSLPAFARHVTVRGDWAFVSLGSGMGVQTVNVANVTTPVSGFRVTLDGFTSQTVVDGNWAYAVIANAGVGVVEVSDPAIPVVLPSIDLAAWVRGIDVQGNYLYVAGDSEIAVLSLAVPSAPDSVASVSTSGTAYCITADGTTAYAGGPAGLDILDISVPTSPQTISSLSLGGGTAYNIAVHGDSLYIATGNNGLNIVDISNLAAAELVATRISSEYFFHTLLNDGIAWASNAGSGLLALQADSQGLDPSRNRAVSTSLNPDGQPVVRAKLVADYADSIQFEVSTNGGSLWQAIAPDGTWLDFDPRGSDLKWRATLTQTGPSPGPICNSLALTFERIHSYADITSIEDVPGDSGGNVRLVWSASRFDAPDQGQLVTEYSVYRRYDPTKATSRAYPPGSWEYLLTLPADQETSYATTVATVADSSSLGVNWNVYFVRARTSIPGTYFDSPPDSGYSLNNLAPSAPTGFVVSRNAGIGAQLTWDAPTDPDFAHFRIYRQSAPAETPAPADLFQVTTGTSYLDETLEYWYYELTIVNQAGLESDPAPHPSAAPDLPGGRIALLQNSPNPFNPITEIEYLVPSGGGDVELAVYDFRGRLVDILVAEFMTAGPHSVLWRGTDREGRGVASGLYTCRLRCAGKTAAMKMTLVR